jgi:hypothetical protein
MADGDFGGRREHRLGRTPRRRHRAALRPGLPGRDDRGGRHALRHGRRGPGARRDRERRLRAWRLRRRPCEPAAHRRQADRGPLRDRSSAPDLPRRAERIRHAHERARHPRESLRRPLAGTARLLRRDGGVRLGARRPRRRLSQSRALHPRGSRVRRPIAQGARFRPHPSPRASSRRRSPVARAAGGARTHCGNGR